MNRDATIIGVIGIMLQTGFTMGAAFMLTRRLWLPIGIHFAGNFTQAGIFGSAVSGNGAEAGILRSMFTGPDWLTGGAFGIEASIVTIALGLVVGIFLMGYAYKRGNIIRSTRRRERDNPNPPISRPEDGKMTDRLLELGDSK